jgi:putative transposase
MGRKIFAAHRLPGPAPQIRDQPFWRMDETYIQVKGKWTYFYRAVDTFGKTLDFMLSEHRDEAAASAFFARTIGNNGWPEKVVIDKSGANLAGLQNVNWLLLQHGWFWLVEILQVKYLNNMIEQDHRFIKKLTRPMKASNPFNLRQQYWMASRWLT